MTINCSEKCTHQSEGICSLNHIINSTGISENNCPYFDYKDKSYMKKEFYKENFN
ncbi:hydroxymyristoyl-ACP dehydratase [Clostridium sp. D2Q-11]|uniref:Hydroxymyristoyl-ACP dehydratase n=1 Tax=Anaeromonas frigoriresistens TaxID=2683708 RepID=A0A942UV18_9FIRM|nr:hydroxymyristoyl-ACP dehydratase [Anaeromonas frigoriresistens]MBS4538015.1 hydroxymyristoyl-ACP dehydratase [Anaeromonas frigoriresistens]